MAPSVTDAAIGLIETKGLIGVLEAADTAVKAADVQLLGIERVGGGLVCVRFRGDTASVQAAVRAASDAVARVAELISAHVIPAPAIDVDGALGQAQANYQPQASDQPQASNQPQASRAGARTDAPARADAAVEDLRAVPLESLSVTRLRQLARKTPGSTLQGRQISRANKDQLLEALRAARLHDS